MAALPTLRQRLRMDRLEALEMALQTACEGDTAQTVIRNATAYLAWLASPPEKPSPVHEPIRGPVLAVDNTNGRHRRPGAT